MARFYKNLAVTKFYGSALSYMITVSDRKRSVVEKVVGLRERGAAYDRV